MSTILQFSGGKDSTALLYLMKPELAYIDVVFCETGATFPHVVEHIHRTCDRLGARLTVIRPEVDVRAYIDAHGLPADVVPVEASPEMAPYMSSSGQRLQSYMRCCGAMLFAPMARYIAEHGVTRVLRGSKKADARVGVPDQHVENGVSYLSPLWNWSDAAVYRYLKSEGASLPEHYPAINDSLDCWLCTAHLTRHGAEKVRWTREHYPDLWPELADRLSRLREAMDNARAGIDGALREAA